MTKRNPNKRSSEQTVRDIRRAARRQYSTKAKDLRSEAAALKETVVERLMENRLLNRYGQTTTILAS